MLKRLVKQQKHYLSLARKSFKNRGSITKARNICQKWEVSGQNERVGISDGKAKIWTIVRSRRR